MPSRKLVRYRSTNERLPYSIETIDPPEVARTLLTLIGLGRIYSIFQIKVGRFRTRYRSCNRFAGKIYLRDFQFFRNVYR